MTSTTSTTSTTAAAATATAAGGTTATTADRDAEAFAALTAGSTRPLLLTGGAVVTANPLLGDWERADVLIGGDRIVGVGPGLLTAAEDDGMIVVDCTGCVVLPAVVDFTGGPGTLTPGTRADVAVVRVADPEDAPTDAVPYRGGHLDVVVLAGRVELWRGRRLDGTSPVTPVEPVATEHPYTGTWVDDAGFIRQELLPDGRYDEARGDRPSAYQGRYWVTGTRIVYLDDLGFWAFGEFDGDVLHHAGYRFTRR
ncbi:Atu4866 domain-containing protein [Saccharothrix sp. Mg75]|uniref:Atu4866 domain-containing protein n=1 Tax=Saccharothrix sp. Mg75 TaxID=3445357 RepID=UPI003EEA09CE